jgi:tetratricopeptide (TPR) repeat protein
MKKQDNYSDDLIIALKDIETVKNDPLYSETDKLAFQLVSDFKNKNSVNSLNESFIRENLWDSDASDSSAIKQVKKNNPCRYLAIAATVLGVVFLIRSFIPSTPDKLYNKFYEPFNLVSDVVRSPGNTEITMNLETAISNYNEGRYNEALEGFASIEMTEGKEDNIVFYQGIACLAAEDYLKASSLLSKAMVSDSDFIIEAKWYLALSYLKTGDIIKAEECFKDLAQSSAYYKESSERILRRLK